MQDTIDFPFTRGEIQQRIDRLNAEESILDFTVQSFAAERRKFRINWHHIVICETLAKIERGEMPQVVIFEMPPRYGKTEIIVKRWVPQCIAKNPRSLFLHLSYSDDLVLDNSSEVKGIIESQWYQSHWGVKIKKDSKSKKKWHTEEGGGMHATSIFGQMTGFGAGVDGDEFGGALIIDDPIKPEDAESEVRRNKINRAFHRTIKSRLNNPEKTPIIIIMQRVHEDDLSGFIQAGNTEFDYEVIRFPALNEDGPSVYDHREEGEPLWHRKHSEERLELMRRSDPITFSTQYQQRPSPVEGHLVKRAWFKYYDEVPDEFDFMCQSWDMTFKASKKGDFVVGQVWGSVGANHYLLYQIRKKMSFTETIKAFRHVNAMFPCNAKLVEEKANGAAVIDTLRQEIGGIIAINPKESKEARLSAIAPLIEAGNVWFPHPDYHPWVKIIIEEMVTFPNAKHDDTVDSCSQYLGKYGRRGYNQYDDNYLPIQNTIANNIGDH